MSITREQVADLNPGDVVEYRRDSWPTGAVVRGPLELSDFDRTLYILDGHFGIRQDDGAPYDAHATLTVIARAPRPLYVNHERTEPVPGDVVQSAESDDHVVYVYASPGSPCPWLLPEGDRQALLYMSRAVLPARLRLLVDGATGQVVPQ